LGGVADLYDASYGTREFVKRGFDGFWIKSSQATEPYGLSRRHGA
jgi:hypothetical protein